MSSIKERLAAAKLPERSIQVCLRGDLAAEFDELEARLKAASEAEGGSRRVAQKSEARKIAEQIKALQEQMAGEMLTLRIRALPNAEWRKLIREHPPKKGHEGDESMGLDLEGFMSVAIPRSVVEPELDAEDWEHLNGVLSFGDYDKILTVVWMLNKGGVDLPKSRLASLVLTANDEGSKRRHASE